MTIEGRPDHSTYPELLTAAVEAAKLAAAVQDDWRARFRVREKAPADLVTDADLAVQKAVAEFLSRRFPGHAFLGEESVPDTNSTPELLADPDAPPTWIVDPIDGTVNYAHDCPFYCVSIGVRVAGDLRVGVIYDHRADEMFAAAEGLGATLNGRPMRVSSTSSLREGLISTGFPAHLESQLRHVEWWRKFATEAQSLRRTGSTALNLAYIACGRFDGYWSFDNKAWDVAAGVVLVREAGGAVSATDGSSHDAFRPDIVASNGAIHDELVACLRSAG